MAGYVFRPTYRARDGSTKQSNTWWVGYSVGGEKVRESAKSIRKKDAERFLAQRLVETGNGYRHADTDRTAFPELAQLLIEDYEQNGRRSLRRMKKAVEHLEEHFARTRVAQIDESAIGKYVTKRLKAAAPATVNRELAALRRMLRLGYRRRMVARLPDIPSLRENNVRTGFVEKEQLDRLLKQLPEDTRGLAVAGYVTGWRVSELLTRRWEHVDFNAGWLRLEWTESKNDEGRQFPLIPMLREVLRRQQASAQELGAPWVFHRTRRHKDLAAGRPIATIQQAWDDATEAAGLSGLLFHDFRRTAVRNLVRSGVPEKVAMTLTGHKTREVFERYNIVSEDMLVGAGEKLANFHGGWVMDDLWVPEFDPCPDCDCDPCQCRIEDDDEGWSENEITTDAGTKSAEDHGGG